GGKRARELTTRKGGGNESVRPPSGAAKDRAVVALHRHKRSIQCCTTNGVIDDVETFAAGVSGNVFFDRYRAIVDGRSTEVFDDAFFIERNRGKNFCSAGSRKLDRDMADATSSCMDEHSLTDLHLCTVDEPLPGSNGNQWQGCRFAHRKVLRLCAH